MKSFSEYIVKDSIDYISTKAKSFNVSLDLVASTTTNERDHIKKDILLDTISINHPDTKTLYFYKAEEFDNKKIYDFLMDVFRIHEPITQSLNCEEEDLEDFFTDIASEYLMDNVSVVVFNEEKELVGICLNSIHLVDTINNKSITFNDDYQKKVDFSEEYLKNPYRCEKAKKIDLFVSLIENNYEKILPNDIKKLLKIDIICVNPSYARLGIAKKLVDLTITFAIKKECQGIISCTTAKGSRKLMENKKFSALRTVNFSDFKVNGELVFQHLLDNGTGGALMFKKLLSDDI
ncbi:Acyl-CoA N-acyltransferase domain-containing protein [Strongyloides ratti]|uniref:Acyl-CoA N-acyltransferase domain-containing protein n=1 Tax=Strongyloides ratti TaxID=34506 RepID=A0A090LRL8_STRRB|nr:Acyl-CoA N-acyltransferase domain-containing protein [Strongyloides ratti]CEF70201.1 Acyl-CoA N-acyltransferase domain-containing protein [Strongyloides ratti]